MLGAEIVSFFSRHALLDNIFEGIFGANEVRSKLKKGGKKVLIINTDKISQPGQHWFVVFKIEPGIFECFDSLGTSENNIRK